MVNRAWHPAATAALFGGLLAAHTAAVADVAAGARIAAARCASCHLSTEAIHSTVPLLEGQPRAFFLSQWREFRERRRTAPVMVNLAAEMSAKDVADLADYYAAQVPAANAQTQGSDAGRALADLMQCASCHGAAMQGSSAGAARLAGQKVRSMAWALQMMRGGTRSHGTAAKPDPLLASLSNADIEALAAHFASLR
jgi:cytochrome c553